MLPHQSLDVLHVEDSGHIAARNDRDSDNDGPMPCSTLAIINPLARDYAKRRPYESPCLVSADLDAPQSRNRVR